jgi:CubicO group peptidase (beta-lactamase class C family)
MINPMFDIIRAFMINLQQSLNNEILKKLKIAVLLFVLGAGTLIYINYPKLNLISGYAAKNMASGVFVANRNADSIALRDHDMPLINLAETYVLPSNKSATASVKGLMKRTAVYKEGLGAVLTNDEHNVHAFDVVPLRVFKKDTLPFPFGNNGVKDTLLKEVDYQQLQLALEQAFANPNIQKTRTALVMYKGQLIAEKYSPGFGPETPILGWSMTKSVLATLYGILEYQGRFEITEQPFFHAEQSKDPKGAITYDHLLRMQSGLAWEEDYFKISDVTKMLFLDSDMSQAQRNTPVIAAPTEIWNYSSGTSNLLSGLLREQFKTHQAYLDFPYNALIDKIGMHSMLLETDLVGNYVGSSYAWANTRDWAKFGLLYLNRGIWNGERLFAEKWVDYISLPTAHSNGTYGAHFWLNAEGKYLDVPRDLFSANGFQGQYVFIIPSKNLVVVRTGLAEEPDFDVNRFLSGIIKALP